MKEKFTLASKKSDIPLTQQCLQKEMKNERRQPHIFFFFMGKEKKHLCLRQGDMQWNMTFKHQCVQSVQSVTGVLDMNVNRLTCVFFPHRVQSTISHINKKDVQ